MEFKKKLRPVLCRLLLEFSGPILLAFVWAFYKQRELPADKSGALFFIGNFTASLLAISWISGQVFRVSKQQMVEERLNKLLDDIRGYSIGTGSFFSYTVVAEINEHVLFLRGEHTGNYPLRDGTISVLRGNVAGIQLKRSFKTLDLNTGSEYDITASMIDENGAPVESTQLIFEAPSKKWIQSITHQYDGDSILITSDISILEGEITQHSATYKVPRFKSKK